MKKRIEFRQSVRLLMICIYCSCSVFALNAQRVDHAFWTGVDVKYELAKKWEFSIEEQLRIVGRPYYFDELLTEVGIEYKLSKYLRPSISYRKTFENGKYWNDRMDFNIVFRLKLGKWKFQDRMKFQTDFGRTSTDLYKWRNKVKIDYRIKKRVIPYTFFESFYAFEPEVQRIYKIRTGGGINLGIKKKNTVKLFSFFQTGDIYSVVAGLSYSREL
jgi:hypothetical protein